MNDLIIQYIYSIHFKTSFYLDFFIFTKTAKMFVILFLFDEFQVILNISKRFLHLKFL